MQIKTFSYRFAEEILQHQRYKFAYDELIQVCRDCPIPIYPDKSAKQKNKDVIQQLMNSYFLKQFENLGWETEPLATHDNYEDALRSDFRKTFFDEKNNKLITIQIEVEFGNVASSYRNYFKFQLSFANALTDICILIVPSQHLSVRIDSGVSNFEKACREIPSAKLSLTVPVLVIGLFEDVESEWNVKEIEKNLKILKGSSKNIMEQHYNIVNEYIKNIHHK